METIFADSICSPKLTFSHFKDRKLHQDDIVKCQLK